MENVNENGVVDKKTNSFSVLECLKESYNRILIAICVASAIIGPIIFIVITSFTKEVENNGRVKRQLLFEHEYVYSVCIITLIICGILFILSIASLIYNVVKNKKKD